MVMNGCNDLHTNKLPKYNCSNCKYFNKKVEILHSRLKKGESYAFECSNFINPICDCILRGFEGHSEQFTEDFEKYNK